MEEPTTPPDSPTKARRSVTFDPKVDEATSSEDTSIQQPKSSSPRHSVSNLVRTLGRSHDFSDHPELQRRVRDFRLAQTKRREAYGESKKWGIYGLYAHLSAVRTDLEWAEDAAWRRERQEPYLSWADFEAARKEGSNRPWLTYGFIVVCSIMLMVEFGVNGWATEALKVNPLIGPSAETLIKVGARETTRIVEEGQWFRIFTPIVLHAGLVHYIINMLAMWFIGAAIEQNHGILNTLILFFIPGIGGNILGAIFLPQYVSVGASGGIFGLIGACLADIFLNWKVLFIKGEDEDERQVWRRNAVAIAWLVADIVINVLLGLTPFIDNFTHLGGLVYGLCCGLSTLEKLPVGLFGVQTSTMSKLRTLFIRYFGFFLVSILILMSTIWLALSDVGDNPCPGCRYISCVPFPPWADDKWWSCDDCLGVTADLYKNDEQDKTYSRIELTCPDGTIENIDVSASLYTESSQVGRRLPDYCRSYCDDVFEN